MAGKAFLIVHLQVKDMTDYFERYVTPLMPQFETYGARVVAAGNAEQVEHLEGSVAGNWHVVIEFPSLEQAKTWYASAEYGPLKSLRMNDLTEGGSVSILPEFALPG